MSIDAGNEIDENLSKLTFKASGWAFSGHFFSQTIRFLGNLILTRLLLPSDFGLMQLVAVFMQGVSMFSDLGISVNIIQHKKGEDHDFLRTAWTIQIFRGILITCILLLIAKPLAVLYNAPSLIWLIPLASINAIIEGLTSMNLAVYNRKMQLAKLTLLDIGSQFAGMIAMIVCAWYFRSVWTLLVSGVVSGLLKTVYSHILFAHPKMSLTWIKEYAQEIFDFGKWIFISSIGGFLVTRLDRVILGLYMTTSELGLYGIAIGIPMAVIDLVYTMTQKVLVPVYSHVSKTTMQDLLRHTFRLRSGLMAFSLPAMFVFIIWGQSIINFLYPENYHSAGWMLQVLAVFGCFKIVTLTISPILFAVGDSYRAMLIILATAVLLILCMYTGGYYYGTRGVIWAIPACELISYPLLILTVKKYNVWLPWLDLIAFLLIFCVMYVSGLLTNI